MRRKFRVVVNGKVFVVEVEEISGKEKPEIKSVEKVSAPTENVPSKEKKEAKDVNVLEGAVVAPMPGKITEVRVKLGDSVSQGDILMVLEAMKMENEIVSPKSGKVKEIRVNAGDAVNRGDVLLLLE